MSPTYVITGITEPAHKSLGLITWSSNEGSSVPSHMLRLARAFVAHIHKQRMYMYNVYEDSDPN